MNDLPDFKGKCISITIRDDGDSHDLQDPYFEMQGGVLFIVGTVPKASTASGWVANCTGAIVWDRVTDYFLFDSLEDYEKATEISRNYEKNND